MSNLVVPPFENFPDEDGTPLEDGYIFIGEAGLSPITNPKQAYWDADLSIPANNIRTKGGFPVNISNPGRLYVDGNYSILVQNKRGATVYSQDSSLDASGSTTSGSMNTVDTISDLRLFVPGEANVQCSIAGSTSTGDGEIGPIYYWDASSVEGDNGSSIIKPTSVSGAGRWKWVNTNAPLVNESISVTQTVVLNFKRKVFVVNASSDVELTIPNGNFNAHDVHFINEGARAASIAGTNTIDFTALTATDYYINAAVDGGAAADLSIGTIDSSSLGNAVASLNSAEVTAAGLIFTASGILTAANVTLSTISERATSEITIGTPSSGTNIATIIGLSGATGTRTLKILGTGVPTDYFVNEYGKITWSSDKWQILFRTDQDLFTTDAVTFDTINTGQGDNELYAMDQDVQTTDTPTFNGITLTGEVVPRDTFSQVALTANSLTTTIVPKGLYMIPSLVPGVNIEINTSGGWVTSMSGAATTGGFVASDGINTRFNNTGAGTFTFNSLKV